MKFLSFIFQFFFQVKQRKELDENSSWGQQIYIVFLEQISYKKNKVGKTNIV